MIFDFDYKFPSTIEELDTFSGKDFERFLFEFFKLENYEATLTDDTYGDKGVDLVIKLHKDNETKRIGIQAKRWKQNVTHREINQMLTGKNHYGLDELWIITTSALTTAAQVSALNNNIKILTRNNVIDMLKVLEKNHKAKFREQEIKSVIRSKEVAADIIKEEAVDTERPKTPELALLLKELRNNLARELKRYPNYIIFPNDTIDDIVSYLPLTIEELNGLKGLGEKRIESYGKKIIETVIAYIKEKFSEETQELYEAREKIVKYNNLENPDKAFTDTVLLRLILKKPQTLEELSNIKDFPKENIELFGNYLIKQL